MRNPVAVVSVKQSPLNPLRWRLGLDCRHDVWVTAKRRPIWRMVRCERCEKGHIILIRGRRNPMSPDHPLVPLIRELCPKRYPRDWPKVEAKPALDPVEVYQLASRLAARGVMLRGTQEGMTDDRTARPPRDRKRMGR